MAANSINILIKAQDNASKAIKGVGDNIDAAGKKADAGSKSFGGLNNNLGALAGVAVGAGLAAHRLLGIMDDSITSANKYQAALMGLNSVAKAFGQDAGNAEKAARDLAKDGLMSVTDAAIGLKNLLAAGFNLDEATKLMVRFKDSAAFGRQSALSFGQAVSSATEGIKNGNSILVDNAGVTKNLSMMLTEAGYSAQDLMKASTDAGVRQAIFAGILKETNPQLGNAAQLAGSAAGQQAILSAQTEILQQKIGAALQPALLKLLETVTPIITQVGGWIEKNPQLAAGLLIGTTAVLGLIAVLGTMGLAISGVTVVMGGLSALVASPIIMPAIAVGAALAALGLVIAKTNETINLVRSLGDSVANSRAEGVKTDNAMRKLHDDGKITTDQLNTYLSNTSANAEQAKNNLYTGFFGPMNRSLDNLFTRITGTSAQYEGSGFGGHAQGTSYAPGGWTWVGERGPELMKLPQGAQVMQNYRSSQVAGEGGGTNITISGAINIATPEAADAFWNRIDKTQRLAKVGMA